MQCPFRVQKPIRGAVGNAQSPHSRFFLDNGSTKMTIASFNRFALLLAAVMLGSGFSNACADEPAGETVSVFGEKKLEVPENWKRTKPASTIVEHEFLLKDGEGDDAPMARVTMMAAGGDVKANIDRWKGQFTGGDAAAQKAEEKKVGKWTVHVVDLSGNFKETMGGGPFSGGKVVERKDYAMLGAILVHPEGRKYFVKMTGPAELVKSGREDFLNMFDGLKD
jgi:hypothetical protein